jgi:hypothetical protein
VTGVLVMKVVPRDGVEFYHGLSEYLLLNTDFTAWSAHTDKILVRREMGTLPIES